jgi:CHAT domain-containing protein
MVRIGQYNLSSQREDLDLAIVHLTHLILLPPLSWLQHGPIILDALFFLASALFERSKESKQTEDAIYATKYLFHLRDQLQESPRISCRKVTEFLIVTLAFQVEFDAGNVMQNIREMAILSHELFTLDTSDIDATYLIIIIYAVVKSEIRPGDPDQPLDELIKFLRVARKHRPNLLEARVALAMSLVCRYYMTTLDDDHEEATSILDEIMTDSPSGNTQDESVAEARAIAISLAAALATIRLGAYNSPEHLEETIYRTRAYGSSALVKEHFPLVDFDLKVTAGQRYDYFGPIEGVKKSSPYSQPGPGMLELNETLDKMNLLLFGIRDDDNNTKIDETIEKGRAVLASYPLTDLINRVPVLDLFGDILYEAFLRTKKVEYLDESIDVCRQAVEPPLPQALHSVIFPSLSQRLLARSHAFPGYRTQDLDESLEILSQYVSSTYASLPSRLLLACKWAYYARSTRHPTISSAYETALALMQDSPFFSPTLQLQHSALARNDIDGIIHGLPLDYASYRVDQRQLEEAIVILERGRALLWSEMRHLRVPIDQLLDAYPDLAHKFGAANRGLEELTKSIPPSHELSMDDDAADGFEAVDPFGRLVLKQRNLLKERAKLISQIQALPGFDSFLASPSIDAIRSAASSGPVIIINHSRWRSDILVLLHNMPPSLIPTPDDFFERACALKDKLLDSRQKYGLDSNEYDEDLASVLAELYTLVGQPVIDRLRQLQVPGQSRVWWCPTSVFGSLPLHAMGPIPSNDGETLYFLDLYICSYTPTLSALIESRRRDSVLRSSGRPSIMLVAQQGPSLPTVGGEIQVVQALDTQVTSLISEAATPATVIDYINHHRFVHFACHGKLEAGKPFEAGFELYGGARLTLLEIMRAHLPTAEFAFLSACHTAEMTEGSVMDEGLRLAAAVQYCGFRSVVGTMWAMADIDGPDLAKQFYKVLFSDSRWGGEPYHERSAKALRFAVKKLRRKRGITLERWVNFVHYGA